MCALRHFRVGTVFKNILFDTSRRNLTISRTFKSQSVRPPTRRFSWKTLLVAGLAGAGVGVGIVYTYSSNYSKEVILNKEGNSITILKDLPDVKISKNVNYPYDDSGLDFILFQYPTCPFCCKVRAFLDYYGLSYKIIEVNPVLRQQLKWTNYKKVPILLVKSSDGYIQLNDSSMIISAIATYLSDRNAGNLKDISSYYPTISYMDDDGTVKNEILNRYFLMFNKPPDEETKEFGIQERKWRKWVDDVLVHVLSPNVYRSTSEAIEAFKWFSVMGDWDQHFANWERQIVIYVGAFAMWLIGKKLKNKYKLKDDVRQSLYDECNVWINELDKSGKPFHGGKKPDLADLAVYGALNSIEGCDAFRDLVKNTSFGKWYFSMKKQVDQHTGSFTFMHVRHGVI